MKSFGIEKKKPQTKNVYVVNHIVIIYYGNNLLLRSINNSNGALISIFFFTLFICAQRLTRFS